MAFKEKVPKSTHWLKHLELSLYFFRNFMLGSIFFDDESIYLYKYSQCSI